MKNRSKKVAFMGLFVAMALIMAYIEILMPPLFPAIPGIKMGLANIVIIFLIYREGTLTAICVSLLRIVLVSVLFGNAVSLLYSLAGGILSLFVMIILKRLNFLSVVGVSVLGGVSHNVGQILMAVLLLETSEIFYYLVLLIVSGTLAGIFVGLCAAFLIKKIPLGLYK